MPRRPRPRRAAKSILDPKAVNRPFASALIAWQREFGRHHLPWQHQQDPYRVWLSEVMLQQTQVATVIPYYQAFLRHFPTVVSLANAEQADVMALWSGLGYYSRARNLHRCARQVRDTFGGRFPAEMQALISLPGIGRSTAAAIAVFAFGQRQAILDGNVKRVFCRHFGIAGQLQATSTVNELWQSAERELAHDDPVAYTQGLMDLGATCCTRTKPNCIDCPVASSCVALASDRVAQLPVRRPRAPLPSRQTTMLVLCRQNEGRPEVLVSRRPDSGIWPGLLSLPESPLQSERTVGEHLSACGLLSQVKDICPWDQLVIQRPAPIAHTFTHFRLQIYPLVLRLSRHTIDVPGQWLDFTDLATAALPAPVKKFLQSLQTMIPMETSARTA